MMACKDCYRYAICRTIKQRKKEDPGLDEMAACIIDAVKGARVIKQYDEAAQVTKQYQ